LKKLILNLVVIVLAVAAVAFVTAPLFAFFAIRGAADANDAAGLARLIDYGAVRQSLRPQMGGRAETTTPPPSFLEDPIGAVRRQLEQNPVTRAPDVDAYLTPAALTGLTRGEGRYASLRSSGAARPAPAREPFPEPVYWGFNRARMAVADEGGSQTVFTFERTGPYEWKLAHVSLPDGPAPTAPRAPAAKR
jgi:hypothetical protein